MKLGHSLLVVAACSAGCGGSITVEFGEQGGGGQGVGGEQGGASPAGGSGGTVACIDASDCDAFDSICGEGACVAGRCVGEPANEGMACDDGLFCTLADHCEAGACVPGAELICPGGGACQIGSCDEASDQCLLVPGNDGAACDDADPCTGDGICTAGACSPGPQVCSGLDDACHLGVCMPSGCVAQPKPNGTPCNDGNSCTSMDACSAGACVGSGGPVVYFSDDFHDNSAGWTLGSEWQIGVAAPSMGHVFGNPDPGADHSGSNDNGVAGVVLGGNASTAMTHGFFWLESPPFDATIDPGPVVLSFYRWLNSDWTPWMNNRVEVWDGMAWQSVWESGGQPVTDAAWNQIQHDLTPYKNAAMRIRFGFAVGQTSGLFVVSSWNLDDVLVATALCP